MGERDYSSVKVLLAERYAPMRRLLCDILKTYGIQDLAEADTLDGAVAVLSKEPVHLVLVDWTPELDALALTHAVRSPERSANPFIPIIVLSANTEVKDILAARDAGATEFLAKPISMHSLLNRVRAVLDHQRAFVKTVDFFGPDRRRHHGAFRGMERRVHPKAGLVERRRKPLPYAGPDRRHRPK